MTPAERRRLLDELAKATVGKLKAFFLAHGLAHEFDNPSNRVDNRPKKLADALDAAYRRDGDDRVLLDAVEVFELGDLIAGYVAPGLPELVEDLQQHADWAHVQRALTTAAAEAYTNPAGAITASRSAIESVCKHICEECGIEYKDADDLSALYKKTAKALNLAPEQHGSDAVLRQTLQGAVSVIGGMAALRNAFGDAHGKSKGMPDTPEPYGVLAVNLAAGVTRLLLYAHEQ